MEKATRCLSIMTCGTPSNGTSGITRKDGLVQFRCFKAEGEDGWNDSCNPVSEEQASGTLLLKANHGGDDDESKVVNEREGPFRDLLWFPESYRRPHENRQDEGSQWGIRGLPSTRQLSADFNYFGKVATNRESLGRRNKLLGLSRPRYRLVHVGVL